MTDHRPLADQFPDQPARPSAPAEPPADDADLADRVDRALLSLWMGSADSLARLLADSHDDAPARLIHAVSRLGERTIDADAPPQVEGFEILGELGRGGMGVVYRARQHNPARDVAIKVLRRSRADDAHLRRFRYEADALATMNHPGIARVFHAGVVEDEAGAVPYLVMEFIQGSTLAAHLLEAAPPIAWRVRTIADVADAIHHAHQRGIIHRDLKPDNILIDADARPRVLDFGVARPVDPVEERITRDDASPPLVGTLAYMSPEQVDPAHATLDVRTDVYTLGVILYESLTGQLPHRIDRASPVEALRAIARGLPFDWPTTNPPIDRELRDIVAMATNVRPEDRYPSAEAFSADLRRYLANEPIRARSRGAWYVARKFAQRNAALVSAAGLGLATLVGLLLLLASLYTQSVQARTAEAQQRAVAEDELAQSAALLSFLEQMLSGVDPSIARTMDRELLRLILDRAAERAGEELADRPVAVAALLATIGRTYYALGELAEAKAHLARSIDLYRAHAPDDPRRLEPLGVLAIVHQNLAEYEQAEALLRLAIETSAEAHGPHDQRTLRHRDNLVNVLLLTGRFDEAEANARESLALYERHAPEDAASIAAAHGNIGGILMHQRRFDEAEPHYFAALDGLRASHGEDHPQTINALGNLGGFYRVTGRLEEAEPLYFESLEAHHRVLGPRHPGTLRWAHNTAFLLNQLGRTPDAAPYALEALEGRHAVLGAAHYETFSSAYNAMLFHVRTNQHALAAPHVGLAVEAGDAAPDSVRADRAALLAMCAQVVLMTSPSEQHEDAEAWLARAETHLLADTEARGAPRAAELIIAGFASLPDRAQRERQATRFIATLEAELAPEHPVLEHAIEAFERLLKT